MNPDPDIQRVLAFWFDRNPLDWIVAPEGFDAQCESELGDLVRKARRHELDDWASATAATPEEGSLALAVLLDQLPRNLFRGTADAFASDAQAWEVATRAIARGLDKKVPVVRASAFYMPLLQRESLISAVAARALSEALVPRAWAPEEQKWVAMGVAGAERHVEQIARFGRYPTRNAVLGRESTEAEVEFLKGHTFSLPSDS
ncbi:hypothetical protein SLS62_008693 [Diatrype stigma]|uniref:DUF924 domain-containing protein n=1 Tax=Diatrype stigma TaxID=117547 RepID=A0AAN9YN06_9PEZI